MAREPAATERACALEESNLNNPKAVLPEEVSVTYRH